MSVGGEADGGKEQPACLPAAIARPALKYLVADVTDMRTLYDDGTFGGALVRIA